MAESLDAILDLLRKNGLSKAEAALRSELGDKRKKLEEDELVVKEIEVEKMRYKPEVADLYPWNFNPTYDTESVGATGMLSQLLISEDLSAWRDSTSSLSYESKKDGKKKGENKNFGVFDMPRLPPVKLKSEGTVGNSYWEEKGDGHISEQRNFLMGSFLDVPVGQELHSSGGKGTVGYSSLSVRQGIAEETSDLVSGLATFGDGSADCPNEYWDSDEYDDDNDVGYRRQPIENETWFLAHEIGYPSGTQEGIGHGAGCIPDQQYHSFSKDENGNHSLTEVDSYFSGEQCFQVENIEQVVASEGPIGRAVAEMCDRIGKTELIAHCHGHMMDSGELTWTNAELVQQGCFASVMNLICLKTETS